MADQKKIANKIQVAILAIFIVFMPLGSWYYLQTGFNYHDSLMSELKDYGKVPGFALLTQNNDTLTDADLHGKIMIANFYNNESPLSAPSMDYARRILGQFKSQKDFIFLFHSLKPEDASSLKAMSEKEELTEKRAYFLSGDEDQMDRIINSGYKIPLFDERNEDGTLSFQSNVSTLPSAYPYFVLIDSSLTIRNYYYINDQSSMDRLVEHLAIILPRDVRAKAEYKPPKEM